jgi:hypothetical protein
VNNISATAAVIVVRRKFMLRSSNRVGCLSRIEREVRRHGRVTLAPGK